MTDVMTNDLELLHLTFEAILGAVVWVLYRRVAAGRRQIMALEAERGGMKKRFEAATAGLHFRLLNVERQLKQFVARPAAPSSPGRRALYLSRTFATTGRMPGLLATKPHLSRGEIDLLAKIRQLSQLPG